MAISRLGRITTAPAGAAEMLAGDAALVAAVIADRPGLTHIQQAKASDRASGARRWDPLGSARAAVEDAPPYPGQAAFSLSHGIPRGKCQRRRCVMADSPFTARRRQFRAANAMRAAGPGPPRRLRSCGLDLPRRRLPGEEASSRERPRTAWQVRDPRRGRPR